LKTQPPNHVGMRFVFKATYVNTKDVKQIDITLDMFYKDYGGRKSMKDNVRRKEI